MPKRLTILFILFICAVVFFLSCAKDNKNEASNQVRDSSLVKEPGQLFFVGNNDTYNSIYKYDFAIDSYEIFWSSRNESVVKLLYSNDQKYIFFLTARNLGIKSSVAFINSIKLYRLIPELSLVEFVTDIGDAIQIFAYWEGNNFRIQFTSFDLRVATYINLTNQIYSPFGKLIQQTVDVFDFIKNSYPQFNTQTVSPRSPHGKFGFIQKDDAIFFKTISDQKEFFVDSIKEPINKIIWTRDENYAFITTSLENTGKDNAGSVLLVYNTLSHKPENVWNSEGKINFLFTNTYLIFDLLRSGKNYLNIYNYKKYVAIRTITLKNGCGLTAVP